MTALATTVGMGPDLCGLGAVAAAVPETGAACTTPAEDCGCR
eukprot:CAMPEP_0202882528 /NCGR_PEP_ID=MMETSP1391-20130828/38132_1 /ASSEMBLY_ACC=CAM_ASM_000867 /TAXON_ID=1034604 /ORGANISM="Chlamydomonas leiostraca, Strain SAG 11-49" /LENGTH=41 /DNA_ID= /DNA_START= /DNA_END= /DNA_ORIENTATION=